MRQIEREELLLNAGIGLCTCKIDGTIQVIDKSTLKIFELEAEDQQISSLSGKNLSGLFVSPMVSELFLEEIKDSRVKSLELPFKTRSGRKKWILCDIWLIDKEKELIQFIFHDITDKKNTGNFQDINEKYRAIVEAFDGLIYICSQDYSVEFMNKHFIERTGRDAAGEKCYKALHNLDTVCPWCVNDKVFKGETVKWELVSPMDNHWYYVINTPVYHANGSMSKIAMIYDITERKMTEALLSSEKERLSVTLQSIGDGVITTDIKGTIILINKVALELTGWKEEEAIGKSIREVFYVENEKTGDLCENPVEKVLRTSVSVNISSQARLVSRDGTKRLISDSGSSVRDKDGNIIGVVLVFRDITEQRKLEEELLKASKIESLGTLAGGIAHDFNNILTAIMGNISLGKMYVEPDDELYEILSEAEKASLRAKNLTRQLLTFSKGGSPIKMSASISELVIDTTNFALSGSKIKPEFFIADDLWPVEIDTAQISQVINNLVINAKEAMVNGGKIEIKMENLQDPSNLPLKEGKYLKITIKDYGTGISKENISRIFDPYFSTKPFGTGLGLASVFSIIKKHDGLITADSDYGKGTVFYIYLPALDVSSSAPARPQHKSFKEDMRILVMDDEDIVLKTTGMILKRLGYKTDFAKDGTELIDIYKREKDKGTPFDLLIMDLTIPGGMGGKEAIEKLKEIDRDVKAIVSSGYSNDPIMADFKTYGFMGVVVKPYKISELSDILNKVLG
ncbi:MAG: PAS domain S-box protein [Candidatus Eremiobacterota bacterium]